MDAEAAALLGLALSMLVLAGVALARRTSIPDPAVLVAVGLAASFLPGASDVRLPPDLVFLVFLPPLVFRAAQLTSPRTLLRDATPLALLSVGLVLATAFGLAAVLATVVPGVTFAQGLVLGAVVAPTDPVAATSAFNRLGAPRRVVDLVENESLINDATALVLYALALDAVVSGTPGVGETVGKLLVAVVGGVAVGLAVGGVVLLVRRHVHDVGLQLLLSLVTPFAAYVPADHVGASGVLAVVTTGVLLGATAEGVFSPNVRLQSDAFWSLLDLLLNAVLFVLLGLVIRGIVSDAPDVGTGTLVGYAALTLVTVIVLRVVWQLVVPPVVYRLRDLRPRERPRTSLPERVLLGWTGMRGAISLAAALAVPLETADGPFPNRPLIVFLTAVVVIGTLGLQGTTLPLLLRRPAFRPSQDEHDQERTARLALAQVALDHLAGLEDSGKVPPGAAGPVRDVWEQARQRLRAADDDAVDAPAVDLTELRLDVARVQREALSRQLRDGTVSEDVARELRQELDLQQVRLQRES